VDSARVNTMSYYNIKSYKYCISKIVNNYYYYSITKINNVTLNNILNIIDLYIMHIKCIMYLKNYNELKDDLWFYQL